MQILRAGVTAANTNLINHIQPVQRSGLHNQLKVVAPERIFGHPAVLQNRAICLLELSPSLGCGIEEIEPLGDILKSEAHFIRLLPRKYEDTV